MSSGSSEKKEKKNGKIHSPNGKRACMRNTWRNFTNVDLKYVRKKVKFRVARNVWIKLFLIHTFNCCRFCWQLIRFGAPQWGGKIMCKWSTECVRERRANMIYLSRGPVSQAPVIPWSPTTCIMPFSFTFLCVFFAGENYQQQAFPKGLKRNEKQVENSKKTFSFVSFLLF